MKEASSEQLLEALRRVLDGNIYVSEAIGRRMLKQIAGSAPRLVENPIERLSNQEIQVLRMIGKGLSTREVAASLYLSVKTVESHRQQIKRKLTLSSGTQLVQYAVKWAEG